MRRRDILTLLGGALASPLVAAPIVASAQEQGRTYRLACLFPNERGPAQDALFESLGKLGFVEGQNLTIDWRSFGQRADMIGGFVADLVKLQPDAFVAGGDPAIRAIEQATSRIPIVGITEDMVSAGFANSLAKPGGNTTGISVYASDLDGKRQDILIEAVAKPRRISMLADVSATSKRHATNLQNAARQRGIESTVHWITRSEDIVAAIDAAKKSKSDALNVLASPFLHGNRAEIMKLTAALQLPAIYQWPEVAEEGGLIGYGPRNVQLYRGPMAGQLAAILRGAKPADVAIVRPDKFDLVVNLQTAKAMGVRIPASLSSRADKLIQ